MISCSILYFCCSQRNFKVTYITSILNYCNSIVKLFQIIGKIVERQIEGCRLEFIPRNGQAVLNADVSHRVNLNTIIPNYGSITYTCNTNHYLSGGTTNWCLYNQWQLKTVSDCEPKCAVSRISSISYITKCSRKVNGVFIDVPCRSDDVVEPGTEARIVCQTGYQPVSSSSRDQKLMCQSDGSWDRPGLPCEQICGLEGAEGTPYIVGGVHTNNTRVPWHVGIYRLTEQYNEPNYTCGGTIVSAKVVVSAIHCFWNAIYREIYPASEYRIVAGKYYSRFNDIREKNNFQVLHISKIHYPVKYQHGNGFHAHDIAVVVLENYIEYKAHVAPICLLYDLDPEDRYVEPGTTGRIAGWGLEKAHGIQSDQLKTIELPVVGRMECRNKVALNFQAFVTGDKFCAGRQNEGIGLCEGDSGGGFAVSNFINGKQHFYLRGIVSVGPNKDGSCDSNQLTLFTNVAHYSDLIKPHIEDNRPENQHSITSLDPSMQTTVAGMCFMVSLSLVV